MYDIPPTQNHPSPCDVSEFVKELTRIGGATDSGFPHLRLVWGQEHEGPLAATYQMNGKRHLTYRHHVKKTPLLAFPVHGVDGSIVDYDVYEVGEVTPPGVCGKFLLKEDIGIPRWFMQQAWAVDPLEWEYQRQMAIARREPDQGPCPEGALVYEEMYCLATHDGCCDVEQLNEQRKRCYGVYRGPSDLDLIVLRSVETQMRATEGWTGNAGWRSPAAAKKVAEAVKAHWDRDGERDEAERQEMQYLMASQLKPHGKRLTGESHGLDNEKYKFVPSNYRVKKRRGKHATSNSNV